MNQLILGDNLEVLRKLDSESVDLIYLDPPFFSNRNYEVIWGDEGEVRSFVDRWSGGMDHYIAWLKERVIEMHRILKTTGSIFLHCDWHANAYIRVEILDKIFGANNFRNEIIWKRTPAHADSGRFGINVDSIFYYAKSSKFTYKATYQPYTEEYLKRFHKDDDGRQWIDDNLLAKNLSGGGYEYSYKGVTVIWNCPIETMQRYDAENKLYITKNGGIRLKRYLDELKGLPCQTMWTDIFPVNSQAKEKIGYPTQKPEALLQRIIECSTNEGDIVLDPFVGGGTTIAVAEKLHRRWIGIDQSVQAVKVTEMRLHNQMDLFFNPFVIQLHKYDYDTLRYKDAFAFESWIITQFGGQPQNKKGGDRGIDGKTSDNAPIQVKRSDDIGVNVIKNFFVSAMQYDKTLFEKNKAAARPIGYIIAFSFGKGAIQEVARLKNHENVIIKLVTVGEIVPISKKPTLTVALTDKATDSKGHHEIEFKATGQSAAGIEFYSWDFDYDNNTFKAEVLLDKKGEQTHKFKPGLHNIAVKVVDNDGLENIEIIKLKVNGKAERQ